MTKEKPSIKLYDVEEKEGRNAGQSESSSSSSSSSSSARTFSYAELAAATSCFRGDCFLGEGGFGKVYKGWLESTGQVVAIKKLDRNGLQGNREFSAEVSVLGNLHHPNLVSLIGFCSQADHRLLVYEYMPLGSLEDHLYNHRICNKRPLDWRTRMSVACDAAKGLEYLHNHGDGRPVIYRDLKCSNILLGDGYRAKLSDFGLARLGPTGDNTHVSTRVMGTYGYCAPEYAMTGKLTLMSDIYSLGVVLLEIVTGRRAYDETRSAAERNLVTWARPFFKGGRRYRQVADPALECRYPSRGLYQVLAVATMCVQEQPAKRPLISDVVTALTYLSAGRNDGEASPGPPVVSRVPTSLPSWVRKDRLGP